MELIELANVRQMLKERICKVYFDDDTHRFDLNKSKIQICPNGKLSKSPNFTTSKTITDYKNDLNTYLKICLSQFEEEIEKNSYNSEVNIFNKYILNVITELESFKIIEWNCREKYYSIRGEEVLFEDLYLKDIPKADLNIALSEITWTLLNEFIDNINKKYNTDRVSHPIDFVTLGISATEMTKKYFDFVNNTLKYLIGEGEEHNVISMVDKDYFRLLSGIMQIINKEPNLKNISPIKITNVSNEGLIYSFSLIIKEIFPRKCPDERERFANLLLELFPNNFSGTPKIIASKFSLPKPNWYPRYHPAKA